MWEKSARDLLPGRSDLVLDVQKKLPCDLHRRNCSRPRKGDRHKFRGNCSAALFDRIGRHLKYLRKIEPVPGP
jgi:hypothetical protein